MDANAGAIPAGVGAVAPPQPVVHTIAEAMEQCGYNNDGTHQFIADEIFGDSFQDVAQVTSSDITDDTATSKTP